MKAPRKFKRLIPSAKPFSSNNAERAKAKEFYQTKQWREFRQAMKVQAVERQLQQDNCKYYQAQVHLFKGQPLCVKCLASNRFTMANTLDHIKPIRSGGGAMDANNVQWLCSRCHNVKSSSESRDVK